MTTLLPLVETMLAHNQQLLIGGKWQDAAAGASFATLNPATAQPLTQVARGSAADIDRAVEAAGGGVSGVGGDHAGPARAVAVPLCRCG